MHWQNRIYNNALYITLKKEFKKKVVKYIIEISGQTRSLDKTIFLKSEVGCEKIMQLLNKINTDVNV